MKKLFVDIDKHSIRVVISLLLICLIYAGCSIIPRNLVRGVDEGERWRVRLVKYQNGSNLVKKGGFDHPHNFSLLKLNRILGAIHFTEPGLFSKGGKTPLFDRKVRATLLKPLQKAFSMARSDEIVDFSYMISQRSMVIFNHDYFTSGIMFIKDGKLNVVMRVVDYQVENYGQALHQFTSDPTQRALRSPWHFVPGPGQHLKKTEKKGWGIFQQDDYPNWLVIDLNYDFAPAPLRKRRNTNNKIRPQKEVLSPGAAPSAVRFESPRSTGHVVKPKIESPMDDPEVREKLQVLRDLYNSGQISRQTYERKKEELLSPK